VDKPVQTWCKNVSPNIWNRTILRHIFVLLKIAGVLPISVGFIKAILSTGFLIEVQFRGIGKIKVFASVNAILSPVLFFMFVF